MRTQKLLILLLGLFVMNNSFAQTLPPVESVGIGGFKKGAGHLGLTSFNPITYRNVLLFVNRDHKNEINDKFYESVSGSPYISDNFLPAKVNDFKEVISARYNAYKDLITIKIGDSRAFFLQKKAGNKLTFANNRGTYQVFYDQGEEVKFFKVLKSTKFYSLLIKQEVQLVGGEKPKNDYDKYIAPYFRRNKDKLYLSLDNVRAVKIPSNKKKFFKLFEDEEEKIKAYVKKHRLSVKKEEDLIKILMYYESL
ncbi:hypothetical protein [Pseudotenacibaculum haliotis]|uniref:Uncharacterized protein n=1 Tax=Pseudotenacibaculum haliotis TaxID=1862138 RepID=A0ABW5LTI6_9FLAO